MDQQPDTDTDAEERRGLS